MKIDFQKSKGLVPVVIQDAAKADVLMVGYMNKDAYQKTLKERYVYFWSRERRKLWRKGDVSRNRLKVKEVFVDCDSDSILIKVKLIGYAVCHKGQRSCFYERTI